MAKHAPHARLRCDELEPRDTPAVVLDYSSGFAGADMLRGRPAGGAGNDLLMTDGPFQARAVWAPDRVHVGTFETSFVFRQEGEPGRLGDGFTFAITGADDNLGQPGTAGAGLGYQGITDSVAVKFDLVDNDGEGGHSVGLFTGGAEPSVPAVRLDDTPIHLHAQYPMRADIAYDGSVLTLTLTDTVLPDHTWSHQFAVDIPAAVGGPTAYVGFTAGTGELFARQAIDSWTYAEDVPTGPVITRVSATYDSSDSPLASNTVVLRAAATDAGGTGALMYTWELVSSSNGNSMSVYPSAADPTSALAYLPGPGVYTFRVTVRDAAGRTATDQVVFTHDPRYPTSLEMTPSSAIVPAGGTVQFTPVVRDQYGQIMPGVIPALFVMGPGTIDSSGLYTAPADVSGFSSINAMLVVGPARLPTTLHASATVQVLPAQPPVITSLTSRYAGGLTAILQATVADDDEAGHLTYTWDVVSMPTGATAQVYPFDPASAAVQMTRGGHYVFRLTVRDATGLTASRDVDVINPSYYASVEMSPQQATVQSGGTVQFTAVIRDQWGFVLPDARPEWQVFGPGTIDSTGLYTAPADVSGWTSVSAWIQRGDGRYPDRQYQYAGVQILSNRPPDPGLDFGTGFAGRDLLYNGSAQVVGDRLRLADGPFQSGSAFAPTPVDVRGFSARFEFQVGDTADGRLGDGLAVVFQNAGPTALGTAGEGLGYAGIDKSVALTFDLVDNAGEGNNSTGLFVNGAAPTGLAQPLWGDVRLHSGHVFKVDLVYARGTAYYTVWDTVTGSAAGGSFAVDIPAAVGGPTAYVGFTGGTGELFAPIDVLDWKYVPTDNWNPGPLP